MPKKPINSPRCSASVPSASSVMATPEFYCGSEENGVYRFRVLAATAMLAAASLTGCGVAALRNDVVIVNAGEPQNPLIPTNTNDTNGGRIVDRLFAGLMSYDAK